MPQFYDLDALAEALSDLQNERKFVINVELGIRQRTAARLVQAMAIEQPQDDADEKAKESWKKSLKDAFAKALAIVDTVVKGREPNQEKAKDAYELYRNQQSNLQMIRRALEPVITHRILRETEMRNLAGELPVAHFVDDVPGLDLLGIAVIVGEAGNLGSYSTKRKLWRRLGFGMAPGHERHAYSTWRALSGMSKETRERLHLSPEPLTSHDWELAGYSPKRLGQIYGVVTTPLFMHKNKSKYGAIYDTRRKHTMQTHPEWYLDQKGKPKVNPTTGEPSSAHGMADAKRVMTKALIADLRADWIAKAGTHNIVDYRPKPQTPLDDEELSDVMRSDGNGNTAIQDLAASEEGPSENAMSAEQSLAASLPKVPKRKTTARK